MTDPELFMLQGRVDAIEGIQNTMLNNGLDTLLMQRAFTFAEQNVRIDRTGVQARSSGATIPGIYWVPQFVTAVPATRGGIITGYTSSSIDEATVAISAAKVLNNPTSDRYARVSVDLLTSSAEASLRAHNAAGQASSVIAIANATRQYVDIGGPLLVDVVTSDPASPFNGMIWYRSDLNAFRVRINGATYSLVAGSVNTVANDTIWDAKGDLAVGTAADTAARLAVGANTTILMADSAQATGVKWQATPAVRYIDLYWDDIGTATKATDAHGGLSGQGTHLDLATAANHTIRFQPVTTPADYNGGGQLQLWLSTAATAGDYAIDFDIRETALGVSAETTTYNAAQFTLTTIATANAMEQAAANFTGGANAGRVMHTTLFMNNNDAAYTLNAGAGDVACTLWKARIAYTPTL